MYLILRNFLVNTNQCPILVTDEKTQSWSIETVCGEKHGRQNDPELYTAIQFVLHTVLPLIHPTDSTVIDVMDAYARRDTFYAAKEQLDAVNQLNQVATEEAIAKQRAALGVVSTADAGTPTADDVAGRKIIPFADLKRNFTESASKLTSPDKPKTAGSTLNPVVPKDKDKKPETT